jgi:hypothetical protein
MIDEDAHLLTTPIAQRLRDAGLACDIVNLVPTPKSVLRRDRIIVVLALALLTGLGWSYLLWLSADMSMGGMDMTGFRMIPSGMGLMISADMPWRAMEFAFVFATWTVMMVGMMTPSAVPMILMYARVGRQTQAHGRPLVATDSVRQVGSLSTMLPTVGRSRLSPSASSMALTLLGFQLLLANLPSQYSIGANFKSGTSGRALSPLR